MHFLHGKFYCGLSKAMNRVNEIEVEVEEIF